MRLAIISCYNEGEANSEYTKAIVNELELMGHDVEVMRLPFDVFGVTTKAARKQADAMILDYANRLKKFDFVSIHYEFLLYGRKEKDVLDRVLTLIQGCVKNRFSVTFHNFPEDKILSSFKLKMKRWKNKLTPSLVAQIIFHAVEEREGIAVIHTFRHQRYILGCCPKLKTIVQPLRYQRNEEIERIVSQFSKTDYLKENGIKLPKDAKIISIIGTLHPYKDYASVIKALKYLPEKYHLFIFGGMHKLSFSVAPTGLPYITQAQELTEYLKLTDRVHFMGYQETTQDFTDSCLFSDYIVMPYTEVGESASASAYTALEFCKYVFCSRNNCFEELSSFFDCIGKISGNGFFQFDMGNYLELAEKVSTLPHQKRVLKSREAFLKHYSITENVKKQFGLN